MHGDEKKEVPLLLHCVQVKSEQRARCSERRRLLYARVITAQFQPGTFDEAVALFRDTTIPALKQLSGFKGALLLSDSTTHKGMTITLWETEANALASGVGSAHLQAQFAKVASMVTAAPLTETYEVVLQE